MSSKNYLFLGGPNNGKTTYFTLMARLFQDEANKTKVFRFKFSDDAAASFVEECIGRIVKQKWPKKTEMNAQVRYQFQLVKHRWFWNSETTISYSDFPGELCESATENELEGLLRKPAEGNLDERLRDFLVQFRDANGLFFVVDAERMFNEAERDADDRVFKRLFCAAKGKRIAIIFSKVDLFFGVEALQNKERLVEIFRKTYANAYAHLPLGRCEFFPVKAFSELAIPDDGRDPIPPKDLKYDKSLLSPVYWMMKMKDSIQ